MASNTRSGRRPTPKAVTAADIASTTLLERLLLAQLVYERGTSSWQDIAAQLSRHPLVSRPKSFFTAQSCHAMYSSLMSDAGLECPPRSDLKAAPHHQLAVKYHKARTEEVWQRIHDCETEFKRLVSEIEEIKTGHWNHQSEEQPEVQAKPTPVSEKDHDTQPEQRQSPPSPEETNEQTTDAPAAEDHDDSMDAAQEEEDVEGPSSDADADADTDATASPEQEQEQEPPADAESPEEEVGDESVSRSPSPALEQTKVEEETPEASPAPTSIRQGKRKVSETDFKPPSSLRSKRAREESEPVEISSLINNGGRPRTHPPQLSGDDLAALKRFQNRISLVHATITEHRNGNIFNNPIKKSDAPDYQDIVYQPMDLKKVKQRIKEGLITDSFEYQRDIYLIFANAFMYNRPGSHIHQMAQEMMQEAEKHLENFQTSEGHLRNL